MKGQFEDKNQAAVQHGGAGALRRVGEGRELIGIAREAELAVYDEFETEGRYALVVRNAARLQACADLYWDAIAKAAEDADLEQLDKFIKRYGWLAGCALRAWAAVKQEKPDGAGVLDYEQLLAEQRRRAEEAGQDEAGGGEDGTQTEAK